MNILLVEPNFPIPDKSRNHKNFLPIGLLKLASYYRTRGDRVKLVRGNKKLRFQPDEIKITSLFTYWSKYVWESVHYYKKHYPKAKISVGGIYASLMPKHCKMSGCDEVFIGIHEEAEKCAPAYDLLEDNPHPLNYQIVHASRGCIRRCKFCGVRKTEPEFVPKESIKNEIKSNRLVFYDNNLLANPYIENILVEIANAKYNGRPIRCESQCGFDGRLLTPKLAKLIKKARFEYPKIAWDGSYEECEAVKKQIKYLVDAGYKSKSISVFMLYNWEIDFHEMEKKRIACWKWRVQISDCRYRPVNQTWDNYNPRRAQTNTDYFIHPKWTDAQVKQFRKNVREQNICVRHGFLYYSKSLEQKKFKRKGKRPKDAWNPSTVRPPEVDVSRRLIKTNLN
jgi:hypothetical protein